MVINKESYQCVPKCKARMKCTYMFVLIDKSGDGEWECFDL
jgi:hypothetical protein